MDQNKDKDKEKEQKGLELKVGKTFKLTKKLGSGAFGEIYHGINLRTNMEVAIKLEPVSTKHP